MSVQLNEEFIFQILSIVEEIPFGHVATYGQIARLAGYDKNARLVGRVLGLSDYYGKYPCHRVVNSYGRCAPEFSNQKDLLMSEGVTFRENGCVYMKKYQWKI